MSALPGFSAQLFITGDGQAVSGGACTSVSSTVFKTDAGRVWASDPTIYDNGTPQTSGYSFNHLSGFITFDSPPTGPVTIDGTVYLMNEIGSVRSFEVGAEANLLDDTTLDVAHANGGFRTRLSGLKSLNGSFELLTTPFDDLDSATGGTQSVTTNLTNGTPRALVLLLDDTYFFAWWANEATLKVAAEVDGLVMSTVEFQSSSQSPDGFAEYAI